MARGPPNPVAARLCTLCHSHVEVRATAYALQLRLESVHGLRQRLHSSSTLRCVIRIVNGWIFRYLDVNQLSAMLRHSDRISAGNERATILRWWRPGA